MTTNLDRFRADLDRLEALGDEMYLELRLHDASPDELDAKARAIKKKLAGSFEKNYQRWYTEACALIKQVIPDRLAEVVRLYHGDFKRKDIESSNYNIQDWLNGVRAGKNAYGKKYYDEYAIVVMRFNMQLGILKSARVRFDSSLLDIAQMARADLFDSELDAARDLRKHGFLRAAGAVAGVVVERHLAEVCRTRAIAVRKKDPTIGDLNDALKANDVVDVPGWRQIQRLGDIRNLCDHNKHREPTTDEVLELIEGADKLTKTLV